MTTANQEKTKITITEFNKKVEIEYCHLVRVDNMKKPEAMAKAKEYVAERFSTN